MGKKVISFGLSEREINRAIRELEQFKRDFEAKCDELLKRIADRLAEEAQSGFSGAIVDDLTEKSGSPRKANVEVKVEKRDEGYAVVANGTDAVWVEFGAGIYHNGGKGAIGKSPNPYGNDLNFTIGGFGENGKKEAWGFYEDGELKITHGTPATMPMYHAVQTVSREAASIAREVFQ